MHEGAEQARAAAAERMTERDGAAVDVEPVQRHFEIVRAREGLNGEGLVDLPQVDLARFELRPRQRLLHRGDGAETHRAWVHAGRRVGHPARLGPQPEEIDGARGGDQHDGGAVIQGRGVARGHCAAGPKRGAQFSEPLQGGVRTWTFVTRHHHGARLLLGGDRHDLALEAARVPCRQRALVRRQREGVLGFARDRVCFMQIFGGFAHLLQGEARGQARVGVAPAKARIERFELARGEGGGGFGQGPRRARHRLDAAREHEIGLAEAHEAGRLRDGFEARGAEAIHRHARHRVGKAGEQRGHPRDVAVVLARLVGAAEDDLIDAAGVETMTGDHGHEDVTGEVVGAHVAQGAVVAADGGTQRVDDEGVGHVISPKQGPSQS